MGEQSGRGAGWLAGKQRDTKLKWVCALNISQSGVGKAKSTYKVWI